MPNPPEHTKWKPGQSGNPSGRPKGFARQIREATQNGQDLVDYAIDRFTNGKEKERWDALEWLTDRGWGKAPGHAPIEDGDPLELGDIEQRIAGLVDELAAKREAKAARGTQAREVDAASQNGAASA